MTRSRSRLTVAALATTTTLLVAPLAWHQRPPVAPRAFAEEGMPKALSEHLEQLARSIPGQTGFAEGPGSDAEFAFAQRAYPDDTISVA